MKESHDTHTDSLETRLLSKGRHTEKFFLIKDDEGVICSDADVLTYDVRDSGIYLNRYEVKTGFNGRRGAIRQAKRWFKLLEDIPFIKPSFVYYNPIREVCQRWKPEKFYGH